MLYVLLCPPFAGFALIKSGLLCAPFPPSLSIHRSHYFNFYEWNMIHEWEGQTFHSFAQPSFIDDTEGKGLCPVLYSRIRYLQVSQNSYYLNPTVQVIRLVFLDHGMFPSNKLRGGQQHSKQYCQQAQKKIGVKKFKQKILRWHLEVPCCQSLHQPRPDIHEIESLAPHPLASCNLLRNLSGCLSTISIKPILEQARTASGYLLIRFIDYKQWSYCVHILYAWLFIVVPCAKHLNRIVYYRNIFHCVWQNWRLKPYAAAPEIYSASPQYMDAMDSSVKSLRLILN